ncbi:MAG: hypothetical protein ACFE8U_07225 [Candidatus Hermodarchaeota archaeon]
MKSENEENDPMNRPPFSTRQALLQELQALKARLESYEGGIQVRVPFFCQLDYETHPLTESAFQCQTCARYVCTECFEKLSLVKVDRCPYCQGKLHRVQ